MKSNLSLLKNVSILCFLTINFLVVISNGDVFADNIIQEELEHTEETQENEQPNISGSSEDLGEITPINFEDPKSDYDVQELSPATLNIEPEPPEAPITVQEERDNNDD